MGVLLPLPSVSLGSSSTIALTSSYIAFPPTLGTRYNTRNNNNISNNNFKVAVEDIDLTQSGLNILIANFHIHSPNKCLLSYANVTFAVFLQSWLLLFGAM